MTPVALDTADGHRLAGRLYAPAATAHAAVLIGPAMGVAQNYYAAFAAWLAEQAYLALSFDYRGMGDSRPPPANAPPLKRTALYIWQVLVPVATALLGYFPGKRLRQVGDLPRGVGRTGHIGFFRDPFRATLWVRVAHRLQHFHHQGCTP